MNRSQSLRSRANRAQERADRANAQASAINERFEGGQPVIINHHSTHGSRRDRNRSDAATRKAIADQEMADVLNLKADRAERIEKLRAELEAVDFGPDDVEIGGVVVWADLNTGSRFASHVTRVNRKSVSVEAGYTVPYDRIFRVRGKVV